VRVKGADVALTAASSACWRSWLSGPGVSSPAELAKELGLREDGASPRAVDTHIMRLRQKLGVAADAIETVRGAGYRFTEWS